MPEKRNFSRPVAVSTGERIQKALSRSGWGSRREIERLIRAGRIRINDQLVALGDSIKPGDQVQLDDGRAVRVEEEKEALQVLLYNKPLGEVCTRSDEEGRATIFDKLPRVGSGRWINVGRLDINTTGLLLLTNSGELAHRLTHPSYTIDREYAVRVYGDVDNSMLGTLRKGVEIDGEILAFNDIVPGEGSGANKWFYCLVQSGRNRAVRKLWESQDVSVSRLMRVRFGNIMLPTDLRVGRHLELGKPLVSALCNLVGLNGNGLAKNS
jgi:23S rRNA pseudouridine2605 synthase